MRIKNIKIKNYKGWRDSGSIELKSGLNVIVGQNNAGKTALIEAISTRFQSSPHKTLATMPTKETFVSKDSNCSLVLEFDANELFKASLSVQQMFAVPLPNDNHPVDLEAEKHVNEKLKLPQTIFATIKNGNLIESSFDKFWFSGVHKCFLCRVSDQRDSIQAARPTIFNIDSASEPFLSQYLTEIVRQRIYLMRAERYNTDKANVNSSVEILDPNCNNLALVLHTLHSDNYSKFNRIEVLLGKVFNTIRAVSVPFNSGQAQIKIWTVDQNSERSDLAIPLSECGTGVGQVLAMLYLIVSSDTPQCILIDEPQSFLHPGAFRSLIEILLQNTQHQYILTTHSPYLLSIPTANVIHVTHIENESKATVIDGLKATNARLVLRDLGFKLSDIFGSDNILWVEGPTEEECFRLIAHAICPEIITGVEILSVRTTGELQGRQAESVYDIYFKLSEGIRIIPPAIGFIFDKEKHTAHQIEDLKRKGKSRVYFLSRRMFENYLLVPEAVSSILNDIQNEVNVSSEQVKNWMTKHGTEKKYIDKESEAVFSEAWYNNVNGARLLEDLFHHFGKITYRKIEHGFKLTAALLKYDPSIFTELRTLFLQVLKKSDNPA